MTRTILSGVRVLALALVVGSPLRADEKLLPPNRPLPAVIDHYIGLNLKQEGISAALQADDATLVRRLTLDLAGRIPTAAEARAYVASKDPQKRRKLVERLLASPDYVRHTATEFDALLRNGSEQAPDLRRYLLTAVRENRPWDRMFRELLGTRPDPNRPDYFVLKRLRDPDVLTRDVSSLFFGVNLMCAQCHKHPYARSITQDYYHGLKAFFVRTIDFQGQLWERQYARVQYKARNGQVRSPKLMVLSGATIDEPKPDVTDLTKAIQEESRRLAQLRKGFARSKQYPPPGKFRYRERLVEMALRPTERERFARSIVNRLWYRFHGYGLVMRLDQMHASNPPSHPALLQWLARDLIAHKYDLRRLIHGLVGSQTYSRSSRWERGEAPPPEAFAVANLRPLSPEQFGVSFLLASDPDALPASLSKQARDRQLERLEAQARRVFEGVIEQPRDGLEINVTEPLRLSNDPTLLKLVGGKLIPRLAKMTDRRQQIEAALWAILSRPPAEEETKALSAYLAHREKAKDPERERLARIAREARQAAGRARLRAVVVERAIEELLRAPRTAAMRSALAQTERYLAAVAELRLGPRGKSNTPESIAAKHRLDAKLLSRWHAYLDRPLLGSVGRGGVALKGLYTKKISRAQGHAAINGWGSGATPWLMANASQRAIKLGTLTLPPRSVSTHPSPTLASAVGWRSPLDGTVRVAGKVADIDPNCGNGVAWRIEQRREGGKQILASGTIDNGKAATFDPATHLALATVQVRRGDVISLVVDARDHNHACDSTHIQLVIVETRPDGKKWNLTADVVDSIHAANPHADRQGNRQVWHFYAVGGSATPIRAIRPPLPPGSTLARWAERVARGQRKELARLAAETRKLLTGPSPRAKNSPDELLFRELTAQSTPLFAGVDFSAALAAEAKGRLANLQTELAELRRTAARPIPPLPPVEAPARRALRQMLWALFASPEFRFNH